MSGVRFSFVVKFICFLKFFLCRWLLWCTCVSASARQSRAQCCAREFGCKILFVLCGRRSARGSRASSQESLRLLCVVESARISCTPLSWSAIYCLRSTTLSYARLCMQINREHVEKRGGHGTGVWRQVPRAGRREWPLARSRRFGAEGTFLLPPARGRTRLVSPSPPSPTSQRSQQLLRLCERRLVIGALWRHRRGGGQPAARGRLVLRSGEVR